MDIISAIVGFFMSHQAVEAALGMAILDFIFAVNPSAASNGLLHWLYSFISSKK